MKKLRILILCSLMLMITSFRNIHATFPTDEIVNYTIHVVVNEDATLTLTYHIDWLVLDEEEYGKLSWVKIGVPSACYLEYTPLTDNIDYMDVDSYYAYIYFNQEYGKGEMAIFEYSIIQDYMYNTDDTTAYYYFTPGWFDEIAVDNLVIYWDDNQMISASEDAIFYDDHIEFHYSLEPGCSATIEVNYPIDLFNFDPDKYYEDPGYNDWNDDWDYEDDNSDLLALFMFFIIIGMATLSKMVQEAAYEQSANMDGGKPTIERTIVTYYDICPECQTKITDGALVCPNCGKSLLKSTTTIKEEDVEKYDELTTYRTTGTHPYIGHPYTYVSVRVVQPPRPPRGGGGHGHSGGGHSGRSGGGHSRGGGGHSCACACASCACACACACAGGGRAGCSNKDFYNTNLKLEQIEKKAKYKKQ